MNNTPMELTFSDGTTYELVPKKETPGEGFKFNDGSPIRPDADYSVEISALEPLPEEPKELWEPEKVGLYHFAIPNFRINTSRNTEGWDKGCIEAFNCFKTSDEAGALALKLKAFTYLWRVATELYGEKQQPVSAHFYPHINGIVWHGVRFETAELCESFKAHASNGTSVKEQFGILFGVEEKR